MIFLARFRRLNVEAALQAAVEHPLDLAVHPATHHQREQAVLVDSLLGQLHRITRLLEKRDRYIGQLESTMVPTPEFDELLGERRSLPVVADTVSAEDLAKLRALFKAHGTEFPEPPPGLPAIQVLVWMMHWVVDHMFRDERDKGY